MIVDLFVSRQVVERFEGLGVEVIQDYARFTDNRTVEAGGQVIRPRRFVVATGSSPVILPIPGLDETPYLTNETLWDLRELPRKLIIIGGGPIGLEMAQAHRRLGSEVVVKAKAAVMAMAAAKVLVVLVILISSRKNVEL